MESLKSFFYLKIATNFLNRTVVNNTKQIEFAYSLPKARMEKVEAA